MRYLALHLRSRRVLAALAAACGGTVLVWSVVAAFSEVPDADSTMVVLLVLLLVASSAHTLGGPDDALERTGSRRWPPLRAAHLLIAFAVVTGLVLVTLLTGARFGPAALVARDAAGLLGLAALGAAVLGAARSWFVPLAWALPVLVFPFDGDAVVVRILTWPSQPHDSGAAAVTAAVVAVAGLLAYGMRGPALRNAA
ncbi:hypothetical protein Aph02nite_33480 [Actinoplanes philippinensis]|uniref:Uncharacterized protein n=1 Tax=Actinoplanes philippinensis TaxID=35752 RepID=A0A1I2DXW7_9ACTN|nr:hypothetical protein [Actinoplanes philippinensis]GIE77398.1 hypothetical protein Aph02nite_33480 [Actinoplanes philippinensis]SFE85455.1 hypothetical protein SAMN05421541_10455 [Actinoplanes philippinensis]